MAKEFIVTASEHDWYHILQVLKAVIAGDLETSCVEVTACKQLAEQLEIHGLK